MNQQRPIHVSTGNPLSALFGQLVRDFSDLLRNPLAFFGGLGGTLLTCGLLYFSFDVLAKAELNPGDDEDDFEIDFEPGVLVKLGQEIPEDVKVVVQETRAEEEVEAVEEAVTEEQDAPPAEEPPPEPEDKPKKVDTPPPKEKKDKKLPTSKLPTTANTPYKNDLPTVSQQRGDPFGDPGGWGDLKKDGDPWATSVMKALNGMKIGKFAAKPPPGEFFFEVSVCKDGRITDVRKKGGSLAPADQDQVRLALEQLEVPKPPAEIAAKMKSNCSKIKYKFRWSAGGVK